MYEDPAILSTKSNLQSGLLDHQLPEHTHMVNTVSGYKQIDTKHVNYCCRNVAVNSTVAKTTTHWEVFK